MIYTGDLFTVLPTLDEASIDACVTDPPYGLGFMAKEWDVPGGIGAFPMRRRVETDAVNTGASRQGGRQRSGPDFAKRQARDARAFEAEAARWAAEVFRVLKPGAHLVAFGGTRMFHRMTSGIEDAGFEIRDCLSWLYAQGFPKSLNLPGGRGTALKPSWEPVILARKPTAGTVAQTVEKFGTGALNIDACRLDAGAGGHRGDEPSAKRRYTDNGGTDFAMQPGPRGGSEFGRWPANVLLDEEAAAILDEMTADLHGAGSLAMARTLLWLILTRRAPTRWVHIERCSGFGDTGGASRFYKVAEGDCILCESSCVSPAIMSGCETTSASSAERRSRTIRRIIDASALNPAHASLLESIVQAAPSVESLCETCVMSIALALVETKCSGSPQQALRAFPVSIPRSRSSILIPNLASFAALWGSTDTIPTTQSLSMLFGSVCHAIENCTRPASRSDDSDQQRFLYSAKPSREERDMGCYDLHPQPRDDSRKEGNPGGDNPRNRGLQPRGNHHPTVKPD
jgi:hypothetical protein